MFGSFTACKSVRYATCLQFELTARLERERLEASLSEASAAKQRLADQLAVAQQVTLYKDICLSSVRQPPDAIMNSRPCSVYGSHIHALEAAGQCTIPGI